MPRIDPLLDRNRAFAATGGHRDAEIMPRHRVYVVTCLDPRVDPAAFLGIGLGDAMVVRNAGGRVTPEVLRDLTFIGMLAERQVPQGPLFEVAVIHHDGCGTGVLASPDLRARLSERSGVEDEVLRALVVDDPDRTVLEDVARIREAPGVSRRISVSGHVYEVGTGLVRTVVPARGLAEEVAA